MKRLTAVRIRVCFRGDYIGGHEKRIIERYVGILRGLMRTSIFGFLIKLCWKRSIRILLITLIVCNKYSDKSYGLCVRSNGTYIVVAVIVPFRASVDDVKYIFIHEVIHCFGYLVPFLEPILKNERIALKLTNFIDKIVLPK